MTDRGSYIEHEGRPAVRFQRTYRHSAQRLWAALTETDELGHWFPSKVRMEPRAGGTITFSDDPHVEQTSGTVLTYDPPRQLAFTWGNDELHFSLEPDGDGGCTLTLIDVLEAEETAARSAAGWEVCLVELDKHLSGATTDGPHGAGAAPWRPYYDAYIAAGMPAGAPIPEAATTDR